MEADLRKIMKEIEVLKKIVDELRVSIDVEPDVKPEYVQKLENLDKKNNFMGFNSIEDFRDSIENA